MSPTVAVGYGSSGFEPYIELYGIEFAKVKYTFYFGDYGVNLIVDNIDNPEYIENLYFSRVD